MRQRDYSPPPHHLPEPVRLYLPLGGFPRLDEDCRLPVPSHQDCTEGSWLGSLQQKVSGQEVRSYSQRARAKRARPPLQRFVELPNEEEQRGTESAPQAHRWALGEFLVLSRG